MPELHRHTPLPGKITVEFCDNGCVFDMPTGLREYRSDGWWSDFVRTEVFRPDTYTGENRTEQELRDTQILLRFEHSRLAKYPCSCCRGIEVKQRQSQELNHSWRFQAMPWSTLPYKVTSGNEPDFTETM